MDKKKELLLKRVGKRGKHPCVDFDPKDVGDPKKGKMRPIKESKVVVTAKNKKGRKVTRKFRNYHDAADHYHKWLRKGHLRDVSMRTESWYGASGNKEPYDKCVAKLQELSEEHNIEFNTLAEIFHRGQIDHHESKVEDYRPDITGFQWGMARVNSFIHGGRARELDADLITEVSEKTLRSYMNKSGKNQPMHKVKNRIKGRKRAAERIGDSFYNKRTGKYEWYPNKKTNLPESFVTEEDEPPKEPEAPKPKKQAKPTKKQARARLEAVMQGKTKLKHSHAKMIMGTLGIHPNSVMGKTLKATADKHAAEAAAAKKKQREGKIAADARASAEKDLDFHARKAEFVKQARAEFGQRKVKPGGGPAVGNKHEVNIAPAPTTVAAPKKPGLLSRIRSILSRKKVNEDSVSGDPTDQSNQSMSPTVRQRRNKKHAIPAQYTATRPSRPVGMNEGVLSLKSTKTHAAAAPRVDVVKMKEGIHDRVCKMQASSRAKLYKGINNKK